MYVRLCIYTYIHTHKNVIIYVNACMYIYMFT